MELPFLGQLVIVLSLIAPWRRHSFPAGRTRTVMPIARKMIPHTDDPSLVLRVFLVRGHRVVLDSDLARLYGVPTFRLNEAIKRNADRFPEDFRFQLTAAEFVRLRSQSVTSSSELTGVSADKNNSSQFAMSSGKHRGAAYRPWVFTEHGALMAATVLNSSRAVQMSLFVVRSFVRMREELATSAVILRRLAEIDKRLLVHDVVLRDIYEKLRPLLRPPPDPPRREIGFHAAPKKT